MPAVSGRDGSRGLLVSVRSAAEASLAVAGGAAIIDVKAPDRGPLGRLDAAETAAILSSVAGQAPVTLACGELVEGSESIEDHVREVSRLLAPGVAGPVAVKAGPSGLAAACWAEAFMRLEASLPPSIEAVAVAYADADAAEAPPPEAILAAVNPPARSPSGRTLLIDTFDKSGPGLFEAVGVRRIQTWVARAHAAGLRIALAGRLTEEEVGKAFQVGADVVGVRSAACVGGRHGCIDRRRVAGLAALAGAGLCPPIGSDRGYNSEETAWSPV